MNYEERYKAALERAKKEWIENLDNCYTNYREHLEIIFPELKEIGDELIKDDIKDVIQAAIIPEESKQKMLTWLEKQDERRSLDANDVIEWLRYHIQVDGQKIEYIEDEQSLVESFIAHAKAGYMAADKVIGKFFGL